MSNIIKCIVKLKRILHPKEVKRVDGWALFTCSVVRVNSGDVKTTNSEYITVRGKVSKLNYRDEYTLVAKYTEHEVYGGQYEIIYFNKYVGLSHNINEKQMLEALLTPKQLNNISNFESTLVSIKNGDVQALCKIKGVGKITANKIIQKYKDSVDNGSAYIELDSLGLNTQVVDKLAKQYNGVENLLVKIKTNPYILIEDEDLDDIEWDRVDSLASDVGIGRDSNLRVRAYIIHWLRCVAQKGDTWVKLDEVVSICQSQLGIKDRSTILTSITSLENDDFVWKNKQDETIGLMTYYVLEDNICTELNRLIKTRNIFKYKLTNKEISRIEQKQGWKFTNEQLQAIKLVLENPVSIITGFGGTGKSSVIGGVKQLLSKYSFAQTALSGRAASKLSEITNEEGLTIHRLLEYNPAQGFTRNQNNPLHYNIIFLDEISMVGAELFYSLVQAIKSGSKLIMSGDDGQLESIGLCNIFKDMLDSGVIPTARLTEIHRQAAKSAIVTESIKVRNHQQLTVRGWIGSETRGELQDLELDIFSKSVITQDRIVEKFKSIYTKHPVIEDIQIIVPNKYQGLISTLALNAICQNFVNPNGNNEVQISVKEDESLVKYKLREGDKVIVNKNNYKTKNVNGDTYPIYNGNKGIVKSIDPLKGYMIISFEQWGDIVLNRGQWKSIELGYALSCHKLQGSDADYVIVGLDYTARKLLTKEWLYTAITRAKKHCVICAETTALNYCISKSNVPYKRTLLRTLLRSKLSRQN